MENEGLVIVDSHIHLYAKAHLSRLAWTGDLPAVHILNRQSSVTEYRAAIENTQQPVRGFIFLETDRISGVGVSEWGDALEEVKFLARIAKGQPLNGEGHEVGDANLVLGIVPWAPVIEGPTALEEYVSLVKKACFESDSIQDGEVADEHGQRTVQLIKGFRYLLQDKTSGTMGHETFIAGLHWLAQNDFTFDLGIDLRSGGTWQLDEAKEMFDRLDQQDGKHLTLIINHFCKPNLRINSMETQITQHPEFIAWAGWIKHSAARKQTYMKLSGFFSELPERQSEAPTDLDALWRRVEPWVDVVFDAFGPERIMFGSDWPVCSAGGPGTKSWQHWRDLVAVILDRKNLTRHEKEQIWSGTAIKAYGITPSV